MQGIERSIEVIPHDNVYGAFEERERDTGLPDYRNYRYST